MRTRFETEAQGKSERSSLLIAIRQMRSLIKVHLTPKYFFCLNKYLYLFETHCVFLPLFNPNFDFLQAVKVTKFGHHLLHDRASRGYRSHRLIYMHVYKDLIRCKSVCDVQPGIDPYPLLARSCNR